jgi:hypothetical protein
LPLLPIGLLFVYAFLKAAAKQKKAVLYPMLFLSIVSRFKRVLHLTDIFIK